MRVVGGLSKVVAIALALSGMLSATAARAKPQDQAAARIKGYRALGAAYKSINDSVRRGDIPAVRQAAAQVGTAARAQYAWFPSGSGPQARVKTAAKAAIWKQAREFRSALDAFARQADAFRLAAAKDDIEAIRSEARKLGGTCKACHDTFRMPSD